MVTIWTHVRPDLDAVFSVLFVQMFVVPRGAEYELKFVPANWDGKDWKEGDFAVDIEAGGLGLKGVVDSDGTVHSCFASLVAQYASDFDRKALAPLTRFIDVHDSKGSAVRTLAPGLSDQDRDALDFTGLNAVLSAVKATCGNNEGRDHETISKMRMIFTGMLKNARSRQKNEDEIDSDPRIEWIGNNREVVISSRPNSMAKLFDRGAQVMVYVDGKNIGIARNGNGRYAHVPMNHPIIKAVVDRYGETDWFEHSSGFLFCRGSFKSPAQTKSAVPPKELAEAVAMVLEMERVKAS